MVLKVILTVFTVFMTMGLCPGLANMACARVNVTKTKKLVLPDKVGDQPMSDLLTFEVLPQQIAADETSQSFFSKVADNSLNLYWRNSPLRHSAAGKAVEKAEKKLNVEAVYQDSHQISHRFNFKVLAVQALAKIQYTGWVNAALNYDLKDARAAAEVSEPLSDKNDLVLTHEVSNTEQKSAVSLQWKW
jgi:hypothetical protein